jgi:hypothetical protein
MNRYQLSPAYKMPWLPVSILAILLLGTAAASEKPNPFVRCICSLASHSFRLVCSLANPVGCMDYFPPFEQTISKNKC